MPPVLCGESSLMCGHCLTNGVGDSWLPAKLSPWDTEAFRGFDEPVGFHEKPLPRGYARSLLETLCRDVFAGRAQAGRRSWSAIPSYSDRKSTRLNSSHLGISYAVFCLKKKKRHTQWHLSRHTHGNSASTYRRTSTT